MPGLQDLTTDDAPSHLDQLADEVGDLVRAAGGGDARAWDALVRRFTPMTWAIARSYRLGDADAGEVAQTTWLRLVEHLDRIQQPERVGAWLATTARREALRLAMARARLEPTGDDRVFEERGCVIDDVPTPTDDRDVLLRRAFAQLSPRAQTLLIMLAAEPPMSYREISAALHVPIGSIGPTRGRCLEALRRHALALGLSPDDLQG